MKIIIVISLIAAPLSTFCQAIDPHPGLRLDKKESRQKTIFATIKTDKNGKETTTRDTIEVKDTLPSRVSFYGLTSLNNSSGDLLSSINGTGRLGIALFPARRGNFKINMGVNLVNANPPKGIKKDSLDFNSLMFPETGNFGFLFGPSLRLKRFGPDKEHTLWLDASFAYRKVSVDSPQVSFKALSYNVGLKYQWDYLLNSDSDHLVFSCLLYWNYFNIPDEDVKKFNQVLNDPLFKNVNSNAEINSIGAKVTMQYKNFIFFFDLRRNVNTGQLDDDNPFKGTKVNIGFATAFNLKSF